MSSETSASAHGALVALSEHIGEVLENVFPFIYECCSQSFFLFCVVSSCILGPEDSFELIGTDNEFRELNLDIRSFNLRALFFPTLMNVMDVVISLVDVSLGEVLSVNNLLDCTFLEEVKLLRAADATAEREDTAFSGVGASGRMSDSKRAVDAMAVL